MRLKRWQNFGAILFVIMFVTACGAVQTDLTLRSGERYEVVTTITVSSQALALAGGEASVTPQLDQIIAQAEASGASAKWRHGKGASGDQVVYVVEIAGQGYGPPFSDNFDAQPVQVNGKEALKVTVIPGAQLISGGLGASTLIIRGGEILETNGVRTDKDAVTFNQVAMLSSGGTPYVILRPRADVLAGIPWLYVGIGAGALLLLGLTAFLIFRPRPKKRVSGMIFCPKCGAAQPRGARVCSRCHRPLPQR